MSANSKGDKSFTCSACDRTFSMPQATLKRFPNWAPSKCPACFKKGGGKAKLARRPAPSTSSAGRASATEKPRSPAPASAPPVAPAQGPLVQPVTSAALELALAGVLEQHFQGPDDGLFTDGACSGNPGPGGWGTVHVQGGQIVGRAYGREGSTTNNRMELMALIAGYRMLTPDQEVTIWSDSQLCVNTINQWATAWERRGWRRKGGAVKNLDLVKEVYAISRERPRATLVWIKAHNGARWNEYADTLATIPL